MTALHQKSMLVRLSISKLHNERLDTKATSDAIVKYAGQPDAAIRPRVLKNLIPVHAMTDIQAAEYGLRRFHRLLTTPWEDGGWRLLPSVKYFDYMEGMTQRRATFDAAAEEVIEHLEEWKTLAKRSSLLYNEHDYPSRNELRERFHVSISIQALPNYDDFRLDAMEEESRKIKEYMRKQLDAKVQGSITKQHLEVAQRIQDLAQTLDDPTARFSRTSLDTLRQLADVGADLEGMIVSSEHQFCTQLLTLLEGTTATQLRDDLTYRAVFSDALKGIQHGIQESSYLARSQLDPMFGNARDSAA